MKKYLFLFLIFSFCSLDADNSRLPAVAKEEATKMGDQVTIVKSEDTIYLLSIGSSPITDNTPLAKITALKEAKILAKGGLMKFIYGTKTQVHEQLSTLYITKKNTSDGNVEITHQQKEEYIEMIQDKGDGILKNIIDIGKWKKNNRYFFTYAINLIGVR